MSIPPYEQRVLKVVLELGSDATFAAIVAKVRADTAARIDAGRWPLKRLRKWHAVSELRINVALDYLEQQSYISDDKAKQGVWKRFKITFLPMTMHNRNATRYRVTAAGMVWLGD